MRSQIQEKEFEKIYRQSYGKVLRFIVVKCNNIDDVNDILQDTYIELLKKIRRNKALYINDIDSFIFGISNNIIKRHYNKKKKENIVSFYNNSDEENIDIEDTFDLEQDFITKDNVSKVWKYINSKDLITSKIFYLYFILGLKVSEVSKELNIGESNIKNRIYRTLKEVKKQIGEESDW